MHVCEIHGSFLNMHWCPVCAAANRDKMLEEGISKVHRVAPVSYEKNPFTPANPDPRGPYKEQVHVRGWLLTYIYKDSDGNSGNGNLDHYRIGESEPTFRELNEMRNTKMAKEGFTHLLWMGVFKCGIIPLSEVPAICLEGLKEDAELNGLELV